MEGPRFLHRDEATFLAFPTRHKDGRSAPVRYGAPWRVYGLTSRRDPYFRVEIGDTPAHVVLRDLPHGSDEYHRIAKWVAPGRPGTYDPVHEVHSRPAVRRILRNPESSRPSAIVTLDEVCALLEENRVTASPLS